MTQFHFSLGSNLEPETHLRAALRELRTGFGALQVSSAYESQAIGFEGPPFWNLAVGLQSDLEFEALKDWLRALEDAQGRERNGPRHADRTLDIDIIAIDGRALERPELQYAFVLAPLSEIAPEISEPQTGETIGALWARFAKANPDGLPRRLDIDLLAD